LHTQRKIYHIWKTLLHIRLGHEKGLTGLKAKVQRLGLRGSTGHVHQELARRRTGGAVLYQISQQGIS
jgi:hypothetical protein